MAEKDKIPEWDIFDRLEEVENLWIKETDNLETLKNRLNDVTSLGILNFIMGITTFLIWSDITGQSEKSLNSVIGRIERDIHDKELKEELLKIAKKRIKYTK